MMLAWLREWLWMCCACVCVCVHGGRNRRKGSSLPIQSSSIAFSRLNTLYWQLPLVIKEYWGAGQLPRQSSKDGSWEEEGMCMWGRKWVCVYVCVCVRVSVSCRCRWTHQRGGFIDRLWVLMISPYLTGIWRDDYANCKKRIATLFGRREESCGLKICVTLCVHACVLKLWRDEKWCVGSAVKRGNSTSLNMKVLFMCVCLDMRRWNESFDGSVWMSPMCPGLFRINSLPIRPNTSPRITNLS